MLALTDCRFGMTVMAGSPPRISSAVESGHDSMTGPSRPDRALKYLSDPVLDTRQTRQQTERRDHGPRGAHGHFVAFPGRFSGQGRRVAVECMSALLAQPCRKKSTQIQPKVPLRRVFRLFPDAFVGLR